MIFEALKVKLFLLMPVKGIKEFGAFVEFMPGKQGLLHISEISWSRLESMDGLFKEGDVVKVKLVGLDPKTGKFKILLSRRCRKQYG